MSQHSLVQSVLPFIGLAEIHLVTVRKAMYSLKWLEHFQFVKHFETTQNLGFA